MKWWQEGLLAAALFAALEVHAPGSVLPHLRRRSLDHRERIAVYRARMLLASITVLVVCVALGPSVIAHVLAGLGAVAFVAALAAPALFRAPAAHPQ